MKKEEAIQVAVRCRPLSQRELDTRDDLCVNLRGKNTVVICDSAATSSTSRKEFTFDKVFWSLSEDHPSYATQKDVFDGFGASIVDSAIEGYNACIFAYGQTGSGKSYSMVGSDTDAEHKGLLPRLLERLFAGIGHQHQQEEEKSGTSACCKATVDVSMMEIYNESVYDLLDPQMLQNTNGRHKSQSLKVRIHPKTGAYVEKLKLLGAASITEALRLVELGSKARTIHATNMNATSSRAHTVFTIHLCQRRKKEKEEVEIVSKINLVDLAGSERTNKVGTSGQRLREGTSINKSLSALGKCISALAQLSSSTGKRERMYIPYRESTLTLILRESLGGNSRTGMLATISPSNRNLEETLSTLRFASRTKKIVNKAEVNIDPTKKLVTELREEIRLLKDALHESSVNSSTQHSTLADQVVQNQSIVDNLSHSWEDRHQATLTQLNIAKNHMRAMGLMHSFENEVANQQAILNMPASSESDLKVQKASLINLNADPMLSGQLVFDVIPGETHIGCKSEGALNFIVSGLGIKEKHATLTCDADSYGEISLSLQPCSEEATIHVNGSKLDMKGRSLFHNDRIIFGAYSAFRVNCASKVSNGISSNGDLGKSVEIDWNFAFREYSKTQMDSLLMAKEQELEKKYREMFQRKLAENNTHIELALEKQCKSLVELQESISSKEREEVKSLVEHFEILKQEHQKIQNDLVQYRAEGAGLKDIESLNKAFPEMKTPKKRSWHSAQEAKSQLISEIQERILAIKEATDGQTKQYSEVEQELSAFVEMSLKAMEQWHNIRSQEHNALSSIKENQHVLEPVRENLMTAFEGGSAGGRGQPEGSEVQKLVEEIVWDIVKEVSPQEQVQEKTKEDVRKKYDLSEHFWQDLTDCIVLVNSTNEIVKEVNEKLRFKIRLASNLPDFDDSHPSPVSPDDEKIVVDAYYQDSHVGVYPNIAFEEKAAIIEQLYTGKLQDEDPKTLMLLHESVLEGLPMDKFIGASYVYLKPLLYLLETDGNARILDEYGDQCGELSVKVLPADLIDSSGSSLDMDILDCNELLGKKLQISFESDRFHASGNFDELSLFADYRIMYADELGDCVPEEEEEEEEEEFCEDSSEEPLSLIADDYSESSFDVQSHRFDIGLMEGSTCFLNYRKTHTFNSLKEEHLNYFENGAVRINIYGKSMKDEAMFVQELDRIRMDLCPDDGIEGEEVAQVSAKVNTSSYSIEDVDEQDQALDNDPTTEEPVIGIPSPALIPLTGNFLEVESEQKPSSKGCNCTIM